MEQLSVYNGITVTTDGQLRPFAACQMSNIFMLWTVAFIKITT